MAQEIGINGGTLTGKELPAPAKNFAQNNTYGIDFAREALKIAKAMNDWKVARISSDGQIEMTEG